MFHLKNKSGRIGLWDPTIFEAPQTKTSDDAAFQEELRQRAKAADVLFVDVGEETDFRVQVLVDEDLPEDLAGHFQTSSGQFRLRAPSGQLRVGALPLEGAGDPEDVDVPPGDYLATVSEYEFNAEHYDAYMIERTSDADFARWNRLQQLGAFGCFAYVICGLLILLPITRPMWWLWLICGALPIFFYSVLSRQPRMQRVKDLSREYNKTLPSMVVSLKSCRSDDYAEIPGGWYSLTD